MKTKSLSMFLGITILLLSMLACNLGKGPAPEGNENPAQTGSSTEVPNVAPSDSTSGNGACTNPYLPIVAGATWNYNLTGPQSDTFTRSIVSVESSSFTDQDVFGTGVTRQGKWNCDNGALTALDPTSGNSASVNSENVSVDFQTTSASGVTLPASLNPGDTWTQAITLEGTENFNGLDVPAKNEFTNTCTVGSTESVTVAAGTFDAVRVDCQTAMTITITMNDAPISTPITFTATSWYAEKVGLIKTVSTGSGLDSTVELTSYSIP
jgi:hypothetical protein